ncbi:MAG: hypothetical protein ACRC2T_00705 [Thermoguttaceae bacterium]
MTNNTESAPFFYLYTEFQLYRICRLSRRYRTVKPHLKIDKGVSTVFFDKLYRADYSVHITLADIASGFSFF